MRIVMAVSGSVGDVFPLVGLGRSLRDRGHHVTVVTSGDYRDHITAAGLEFVENLTAEVHRQFLKGVGGSAKTRPRKRRDEFRKVLSRRLHGVYGAAEEAHRKGPAVVLAVGAELFAAVAAHERLGVPWARVYHVPRPLHRVQPRPRVPGRWNHALLVAWDTRLGWRARAVRREVDRFRDQLGLRRSSGASFCPAHLTYSPLLNLGLFPEWIAPWFRGFPPNTVMSAFPLYDAARGNGLPVEVERFLSAGPPPVAFAVPSWKRGAEEFFQQSVEACKRMGRRAILLDPAGPQESGDHYLAARYLPYNALLPKISAFVHGGGAGSMGAALASGVPQLCVPWALDQFFNSRLVEDLECGEVLRVPHYRADRVAESLQRLREDKALKQRCRQYAERCRSGPGLEPACEAIERLGDPGGPY